MAERDKPPACMQAEGQPAQPHHAQNTDWPMAPDCSAQADCTMQDTCLESSLQEPVTPGTLQQSSHQHWQLQQLVQSVSPEDDPFLLARYTYQGPFDQRAHTITLDDLKQLWLSDVEQLRLCLQRLQTLLQDESVQIAAPPPVDPESDYQPTQAAAGSSEYAVGHGQDAMSGQRHKANPLRDTRDQMMSMFYLVTSLAAVGRVNLYFDLQLENWKTGGCMPATASLQSHTLHVGVGSTCTGLWPMPLTILCALAGDVLQNWQHGVSCSIKYCVCFLRTCCHCCPCLLPLSRRTHSGAVP